MKVGEEMGGIEEGRQEREGKNEGRGGESRDGCIGVEEV